MRLKQKSDVTVSPGAFIPERAALLVRQKRRRLKQRVWSGAAVSLFLLLGVGYSTYDARIGAQLSGAAYVVVQNATAYTATHSTETPTPSLNQAQEFSAVVAALVADKRSFIAVDEVGAQVTLFKDGSAVLVAPILLIPDHDSWRSVPSGVYTVKDKTDRQYSALQEVYENNVVMFSKNYIIHGTPEYTDGSMAADVAVGITLSSSDAAALYRLVTPGISVVVRASGVSTDPTVTYSFQGPTISSGVYAAADLTDGQILVGRGGVDTSYPIASLTKLMTAVVVAESYDIDAEVLVDQEQYVTTLIPRLEGVPRTTNYNLLQLLLSESSNEAAEVLASEMGRDQFIARMNTLARTIGMTNSTFADPSGLDDGNVASLRDLVTLAQYIYNNYPFIWKMTMHPDETQTARGDDFGDLRNFNGVAGLSDMVGGKVGETDAAGQTSVTIHAMSLAGTARTVVIALLGSQERSVDVSLIHQYIADHIAVQ